MDGHIYPMRVIHREGGMRSAVRGEVITRRATIGARQEVSILQPLCR